MLTERGNIMKDKKIVAYLFGLRGKVPQAETFTHANYAFGWVMEDSIVLDHPEELELLDKLREKQEFKLLVSLQQKPPKAFCERSKTPEGREKLAKQAKELLDTYHLDGIDVDWEYPGIELSTGKDNCDTCREDFIALLAAIRKEIGNDKLLTIACGATPDTWRHTDFARAAEILDFINVMGYDYNWNKFGKAHHSNLFPATVGIGDNAQCGDRAVQMLLDLDIPAEKLVLGLPFYGCQSLSTQGHGIGYSKTMELIASGEYELCYDLPAKQSYVAKDGEMVIAFDDLQTIAWKAEYVKAKGMSGIMYWAYGSDDEKGTLRHAVYDELIAKD